MSMSKDLFLAILSMDSYNRGYGSGVSVDGLGEACGTAIGNAKVSFKLSDVSQAFEADAQASGFYAIAYDTPYGTVISYRGTDNGPDYLRGWVMGAGLETTWTQADEALSFYSAVTGKNYWEGPAENTIVVGHSLGGGLAGFVSALTGTEGYGFDYMPFGIAAWFASKFDEAHDVDLNFQNFRSLCVEKEILESVRDGSIQISVGVILSALSGFLGLAADQPALAVLLSEAMNAFGLSEAAGTVYFESQIPSDNKNYLDSHSGVTTLELIDRALKLHMQDYLINLQFAREHGKEYGDWAVVGTDLFNAYFDSAIAEAAGADRLQGAAGIAGKMGRAIAYSVLEEGQLVFGDSGVRAMFDDLDDLGRIYKQEDHDAFLDAYVTQLDSVLPLPELATVRSLLVRTVVEYAGALALNKVTRSGVKQQIDGVDVEKGVIAISDDAKTLALDLSSVLWGDVLKTGTAGSRVVIPEDMLRELSDRDDGVYRAVRSFRTRHKADGRVISPEYDLGETLRQADPNVNLANAGDDGIKHLMAGSVPDAVMALRETAFVPPPSL